MRHACIPAMDFVEAIASKQTHAPLRPLSMKREGVNIIDLDQLSVAVAPALRCALSGSGPSRLDPAFI